LTLILIGVGVLAAPAALYFLVLKKDSEKIHDDFDSAADHLWLPRTPSAWTVAGGYYILEHAISTSNTQWWQWNLYNRSWTKPNYTITTRMRINASTGYFGVLLVNNSSMDAVGGYQFMFNGDGSYFIRKVDGWNYSNSTATGFTYIKNWTVSPAITVGANSWNTYKIVKAGSDYKLYANDTLVFSFNDATYDPRLVAVTGHTQLAIHLEIDSFYVDVN